LEVGPGLGILTQELARQVGWVIAVELDQRLAAYLRESLAAQPNVTVVQADILRVDLGGLLGDGGGSRRYKVVADLPYYITAPVLRYFLEAVLKPSLIVVMLQREVARRILARPGEMSLLALGVQIYGRPSMVGLVSRRSFYPVPKVDSAILRIDVFDQPAVGVDTATLFRVARAGFAQPRKQLRNALAHGLGLSSQAALALLAETDIDPHLRAEDLSLEQWERLAREWRGPSTEGYQ
jgi:16S rRNA (adenine1518-N6/adenine1519-N6)-dimethyltransferase